MCTYAFKTGTCVIYVDHASEFVDASHVSEDNEYDVSDDEYNVNDEDGSDDEFSDGTESEESFNYSDNESDKDDEFHEIMNRKKQVFDAKNPSCR